MTTEEDEEAVAVAAASLLLTASKETIESFADDVRYLWCGGSTTAHDDAGYNRGIPALESPPSSLEFVRDYVMTSRPCIIKNAFLVANDDDDDCCGGNGGKRSGGNDDDDDNKKQQQRRPLLLTLDEIVDMFPDDSNHKIVVDVSPDGHADTIRLVQDSHQPSSSSSSETNTQPQRMFVEPARCEMPIHDFRRLLRRPPRRQRVDDTTVSDPFDRVFDSIRSSTGDIIDIDDIETYDDDDEDAVYYYSRQNDCLRTAELRRIWDSGILPAVVGDWAQSAFGIEKPDAVNLWIGNEHVTTAMHKDHYENLFYVLSGCKVFTLCPPANIPFLYEQEFPSGRFCRCSSQQQQQQRSSSSWTVVPNMDEETSTQKKVHWIATDRYFRPNLPQNLLTDKYPLLKYTHPVTITVHAGEMLYLPALWFHSVTQSCETVGVNYWYDMKFDSPSWCYFHLLQQMK